MLFNWFNVRNKKKEDKRGEVVKNDRQAMKILGLLENPDKKEVILFNFVWFLFQRSVQLT